MSAPRTGRVHTLLLLMCRADFWGPETTLSQEQWDLFARLSKRYGVLDYYDTRISLWRIAHKRPAIAQAMRESPLPEMRERAAILDSEAALEAIDAVMNSTPSRASEP